MKNLGCLLIFILLGIVSLANGTWNQISIYNGGACDMTFSFTIGSKGYVGGGRTNINTFKSDLWEFDPTTNAWNQKANFPGGNRSTQASFVINDKAYVGLGFSLQYYDQFYEYDPSTNVWVQKANFPGGARYSSSWFTIGNSGYIVGGWNGSAHNDCWEYTPSTDTWIQKADFPAGPRQASIGFSLNNLGYICTGFNSPAHFNDLWEFDPVNNTWLSKSPFPGSPRRGCAAFVINNEAYIGLGYDDTNYMTDFYKYNPNNDTWSQEADFGGSARYNSFYFALNNKGYVGVGSYGPISSPSFYDDIWVFEPASDYNLIQGRVFADFDNNSALDSIEPVLPNRKIREINTGNLAFSNQNGYYSLVVHDTGSFQVEMVDSLANFSSVPASHSCNFTSFLQVDSLNDFAFQASGTFDDLCITLSATSNFRSGMDASYVINYSNVGNTTINGTVVFYPDTNITFVNSMPAATSATTDSVIFSIGNIAPFQTGQISVQVNVDLGLSIGTQLISSAMILPIVGDVNPTCNLSTWEVLTTGSYDPNDIAVSRKFLYDYEVASQPELDYLIRFQNTGNDTAFTVKVMNPIDTNGLQLSTFEFVATSHPVNITWVPSENAMRFLFQNILLPDSNVNEPSSHGFVRYKIKPKTSLSLGDSITSQALIYFDFNSAVPTNIARTDIISPLGVFGNSVREDWMQIYPNPVRSIMVMKLKNDNVNIDHLLIYNVYGQQIKSIDCRDLFETNYIKSIDVTDLPSGYYFIRSIQGGSSKGFVKY